MMWIGITGPMGSGKSTVALLLRQMGFEVLDADEGARQVLNPGSPGEAEVFRTFGGDLRGADGKLDRRLLGQLVFADAAKLAKLEQLIHPLLRQAVAQRRRELEEAGHFAAFYDVPLLFEKAMQDQFDHVLVVNAPSQQRLERLWNRSKLSPAEVQQRSVHHVSEQEKERLASAVVRNSGSLEDLKVSLLSALKQLGVPLPTATQS